MFKAKLVELPERVDEKTQGKVPIGSFTAGRKYKVFSVFDNGQFTDFLVADDRKVFYWINVHSFRGL